MTLRFFPNVKSALGKTVKFSIWSDLSMAGFP
jgi:hypothetical protein